MESAPWVAFYTHQIEASSTRGDRGRVPKGTGFFKVAFGFPFTEFSESLAASVATVRLGTVPVPFRRFWQCSVPITEPAAG